MQISMGIWKQTISKFDLAEQHLCACCFYYVCGHVFLIACFRQRFSYVCGLGFFWFWFDLKSVRLMCSFEVTCEKVYFIFPVWLSHVMVYDMSPPFKYKTFENQILIHLKHCPLVGFRNISCKGTFAIYCWVSMLNTLTM